MGRQGSRQRGLGAQAEGAQHVLGTVGDVGGSGGVAVGVAGLGTALSAVWPVPYA